MDITTYDSVPKPTFKLLKKNLSRKGLRNLARVSLSPTNSVLKTFSKKLGSSENLIKMSGIVQISNVLLIK